jgi:hypothetical protein
MSSEVADVMMRHVLDRRKTFTAHSVINVVSHY